MDELDKLKNHWKQSQQTYPKVSESQIYAMLHKRSSSIVKWILIISAIEFCFWTLCTVMGSFINTPDYQITLTVLDYVNLAVLIVFVILFYINFKKISTEKPVKELMRNIITIRRVVRVYMFYIISTMAFALIYTLFSKFDYDPEISEVKVLATAIGVVTLMLLLAISIYSLLYGRLLRKLNKNYKELEKMQDS